MKEGLEANRMKSNPEEMSNIIEGMEADHEKMVKEAVERARSKILNNSSVDGTNDVVPDLSMPSMASEFSDEEETGITGI